MTRRVLLVALLLACCLPAVGAAGAGLRSTTISHGNVIRARSYPACPLLTTTSATPSIGGSDWRASGDGGAATSGVLVGNDRVWLNSDTGAMWTLQSADGRLRSVTTGNVLGSLTGPSSGSTTLAVGGVVGSTTGTTGMNMRSNLVDGYYAPDSSTTYLLTSSQILAYDSSNTVTAIYPRVYTDPAGTNWTAQRVNALGGGLLSGGLLGISGVLSLSTNASGDSEILLRTALNTSVLDTGVTAYNTATNGNGLGALGHVLGLGVYDHVIDVTTDKQVNKITAPLLAILGPVHTTVLKIGMIPGATAGFRITQIVQSTQSTSTFYFVGEDPAQPRKNNAVWRVAGSGTVDATVLAGDPTADWGYVDGTGGMGGTARFAHPTDLAFRADGRLWVADSRNYRLREIAIASPSATSGTVSTVAGRTDVGGPSDLAGPGPFPSPSATGVDVADATPLADGSLLALHDGRVLRLSGGSWSLLTSAAASAYESFDALESPLGTTSAYLSGTSGLWTLPSVSATGLTHLSVGSTQPTTGTTLASTADGAIGDRLGRGAAAGSLLAELRQPAPSAVRYVGSFTGAAGTWTRVAGTVDGSGSAPADGATALSVGITSEITGLGALPQGTNVFSTTSGAFEILPNGKLYRLAGGGTTAPANGVLARSANLPIDYMTVSANGDLRIASGATVWIVDISTHALTQVTGVTRTSRPVPTDDACAFMLAQPGGADGLGALRPVG